MAYLIDKSLRLKLPTQILIPRNILIVLTKSDDKIYFLFCYKVSLITIKYKVMSRTKETKSKHLYRSIFYNIFIRFKLLLIICVEIFDVKDDLLLI